MQTKTELRLNQALELLPLLSKCPWANYFIPDCFDGATQWSTTIPRKQQCDACCGWLFSHDSLIERRQRGSVKASNTEVLVILQEKIMGLLHIVTYDPFLNTTYIWTFNWKVKQYLQCLSQLRCLSLSLSLSLHLLLIRECSFCFLDRFDNQSYWWESTHSKLIVWARTTQGTKVLIN